MSTKRVRFGSHFYQAAKPPMRIGGQKVGNKVSKKTKAKKKPDWDTTVSDLTVHKLSKEEQEKRRLGFQSKNAEAAKHDLYEKAKGSFDLDISGNLRPSPTMNGLSGRSKNSSKLAALQQALHGRELHDVLAESDRTLAVVRDLFGDDPKRYTCQPNVTVAPHIITDKGRLERTILESSGDGPSPTALSSPGGIRDESILELAPRKPALNELPSPTPELEDDETLTADGDDLDRAGSADFITPHSRGYQPTIDLTRFQKLVESEERSSRIEEHPQHRLSHTRKLNNATEILDSGQNKEKLGQQPEKQGRRQVHPSSAPSSASTRYKSTSIKRAQNYHRKQVGVKDVEEAELSVDGMSELSSISPTETGGGRDNITADSETSAVHCEGEGSSPDGRLTPPSVEGRNRSGRQAEVDKMRHRVASSLIQHPLHLVHTVAPTASYKLVNRERSTEQPCQDKVHSQLHTLQEMVENLEREVTDYEEASNVTMSLSDITNTPQSQNLSPTHHSRNSGSLGSMTKSLLLSMTKMMSYLRQSEVQLKGEVAVRVQMLQTMTEQQNLMDSLTADLIKLRSENVTLRQELVDLKNTSSEQIRKIQDDFADVHKKLSSLAVSHTHLQTPPLAYHGLPLLPPHLLQTPPPFPPPQAQTHTPTTTGQNEQHLLEASHRSSVTFSQTNTHGGVSFTPTTTPQGSAGHVMSQVQPCTTDLSRQLNESVGASSLRKASECVVDSCERRGVGQRGPHCASLAECNPSSSKPVLNSAKSPGTRPSVSSLAPPPLSQALQVPGLHTPPFTSHQLHSSAALTTTTSFTSAPSLLSSRSAFDVEAFINSLRKNQPHFSTSVSSVSTSGTFPTSATIPGISTEEVTGLLSQPHSMKVANAQWPVTSQRDGSVHSSVPVSEDTMKVNSVIATDTDEHADSSNRHTNSGLDPTGSQQEVQEMEHRSGKSMMTEVRGDRLPHASLAAPPLTAMRNHQGLARSDAKQGWFSLTSHLSQS